MGNIDIFRSTLEGQVNLVEAALAANPALAKSKDSTSDNRTALHHAASVGSLEIAQILLSNGADVDAKDDTGFTPLIVAVAAGKGEVVSELIGNGAEQVFLYAVVCEAYSCIVASKLQTTENRLRCIMLHPKARHR